MCLNQARCKCWMIDERSSSSILRKTISEPPTLIKPGTWWPVRRSKHSATKTHIAGSGASSTYCTYDVSGSHDVLMLLMRYICWKCGTLEISCLIDERLSSFCFRKTISEPQTGIRSATFWWPVRRYNNWATKTQMASSHASLGSSPSKSR